MSSSLCVMYYSSVCCFKQNVHQTLFAKVPFELFQSHQMVGRITLQDKVRYVMVELFFFSLYVKSNMEYIQNIPSVSQECLPGLNFHHSNTASLQIHFSSSYHHLVFLLGIMKTYQTMQTITLNIDPLAELPIVSSQMS